MRIRRYEEQDRLHHALGSVRAVEVASFSSGASIYRWFDAVRPGLFFDLVRDPDAVFYDMTPVLGVKLRFDATGELVLESDVDLYTIDASDEEKGQIRWFLEYLGVSLRRKAPVRSGYRSIFSQIKKVRSVQGTFELALPEEEAELFAMLGEKLPVLWDDSAFVGWVEERFGVKAG